MRIGICGVVAISLLTAACGTNTTQRAASGGIAGVAVGALVGGPVGAIVGAAAGGLGGWAMPEGAETLASNAIHKEKEVSSRGLNSIGMGTVASGQSPSAAEVKRAQTELQREGVYRGPIDGIMGQRTRDALAAYQEREGLRQTAMLDRSTRDRLNSSMRSAQNPRGEGSGSSTPPDTHSEPQAQDKEQQGR
jgi:hypothetical protein